jgi:hypothetical protein
MFSYVIFNNNHNSLIDKFLLSYASVIAEVVEDHVLVVRCGSTILAAT